MRQLEGQDLPGEPFPADRRQDFRVYLAADVHGRMAEHAAADVSVEICGVMVGHWGRDDDGPYVKVHEMIRSDLAAGRSGEVTFTHDAWAEITKEMDAKFPELTIIGWYHSHPDFGIFLSQRDCFIHEHFFSSPGQIAYVVDPVRKIDGVFAWREGKPISCPYYWVGDRIVAGPPGVPSDPPVASDRAIGQSASPASRPSPADAARELPAGSFLGDGRRLAIYFLVFVVGYLLAAVPGAWQRERIIEGTVAHYGLWKGLRPGLREHLNALDANLKKMQASADELAVAPPEPADGEAAEEEASKRKEQWKDLQKQFVLTQRLVGAIADRYCLDRTEAETMERLIAAKLAELKLQQESEKAKEGKKEKKKEEGKPEKTKPPEGKEQGAAAKAAAPRPASQPKAAAPQKEGRVSSPSDKKTGGPT